MNLEGANARSRLECLRCQQNQDNLHKQAYASIALAYPCTAREPLVVEKPYAKLALTYARTTSGHKGV